MFFDGKDIKKLLRDIDISGLDQIVKELRFLEESDPAECEKDKEPPEAEPSQIDPKE